MASAKQKQKIMTGLSSKQARAKLLEIYAQAEPGADFDQKYPKVYPWLECWFRLRARSETFDCVAQAFAEKVTKLNKEKRRLEQIIHTQREELAKRNLSTEEVKGIVAGAQDVIDGKTRPFAEIQKELRAGVEAIDEQ